MVSTATSWSLVPAACPVLLCAMTAISATPSSTAAQPGCSTTRAITAISAAAMAAISAARTLSRIEMPLISQSAESDSLIDLPRVSDSSSGISAKPDTDHTVAASDAALIDRYPPTSSNPLRCGGTSQAAANSQPTVMRGGQVEDRLDRREQQLR